MSHVSFTTVLVCVTTSSTRVSGQQGYGTNAYVRRKGVISILPPFRHFYTPSNHTIYWGKQNTTAYLREGGRTQLLRRRMEVGSGFPRWLWRSMEGWRLVCDSVLWHFPSKNHMGSERRVSVRVPSDIGCNRSCGNTSCKQIFLDKMMVTMTSQFWTHHGIYIIQQMFFFEKNSHSWWLCNQNLP